MGETLAIKGDKERGNEVITLLEMLGGKNKFGLRGLDEFPYFIANDNVIWCEWGPNINYDKYQFFTLDEFIVKFPFKIHDLVNIPEYESTVGICGMRWDPYSKHMEYMVYRNDDAEWYAAEELLDYNDNPNEINKNMEEKEINQMSLENCDLDKVEIAGFMQVGKTAAVIFNDASYEDEVELQLGNYEIEVRDGKIYAVRKKSKYPKTYEECCQYLGCDDKIKMELIGQFIRLINARNTYWKIAGERMGLDKPWEPDWKDERLDKYCIYCDRGDIKKGIWCQHHYILAFPTEEMRDAFYENFKELIEYCKELL